MKPGVGLLSHMGNVCLRNCQTVVSVPFCIPTNDVESSSLFTSSSALSIFLIFFFLILAILSIVTLIYFSLMANGIQQIFLLLLFLCQPYIFFAVVSVCMLCPVLHWVIFFLLLIFESYLYILDISLLLDV